MRLEVVQFGEDVFGIEVDGIVIDALESHDAIGVHDEHRAIGRASLFVVDAVCLRYRALGVEVRQQRIGYAAQRCGVCGLGRTGVAANAQNLGILLFEQRVSHAERRDLSRSTACEREYMKREYDRLIALEAAECYISAVLRWQRKVRRRLSNIYHCIAFLLSYVNAFICARALAGNLDMPKAKARDAIPIGGAIDLVRRAVRAPAFPQIASLGVPYHAPI